MSICFCITWQIEREALNIKFQKFHHKPERLLLSSFRYIGCLITTNPTRDHVIFHLLPYNHKIPTSCNLSLVYKTVKLENEREMQDTIFKYLGSLITINIDGDHKIFTIFNVKFGEV